MFWLISNTFYIISYDSQPQLFKTREKEWIEIQTKEQQ